MPDTALGTGEYKDAQDMTSPFRRSHSNQALRMLATDNTTRVRILKPEREVRNCLI